MTKKNVFLYLPTGRLATYEDVADIQLHNGYIYFTQHRQSDGHTEIAEYTTSLDYLIVESTA